MELKEDSYLHAVNITAETMQMNMYEQNSQLKTPRNNTETRVRQRRPRDLKSEGNGQHTTSNRA